MTDNNFHKLALSESFERVAKVTGASNALLVGNEYVANKG